MTRTFLLTLCGALFTACAAAPSATSPAPSATDAATATGTPNATATAAPTPTPTILAPTPTSPPTPTVPASPIVLFQKTCEWSGGQWGMDAEPLRFDWEKVACENGRVTAKVDSGDGFGRSLALAAPQHAVTISATADNGGGGFSMTVACISDTGDSIDLEVLPDEQIGSHSIPMGWQTMYFDSADQSEGQGPFGFDASGNNEAAASFNAPNWNETGGTLSLSCSLGVEGALTVAITVDGGDTVEHSVTVATNWTTIVAVGLRAVSNGDGNPIDNKYFQASFDDVVVTTP